MDEKRWPIFRHTTIHEIGKDGYFQADGNALIDLFSLKIRPLIWIGANQLREVLQGGFTMEVTHIQTNHYEPQQESHPVEHTSTWEKPVFKVISVSLECSAYAGAI
jgi:hypothetical protein